MPSFEDIQYAKSIASHLGKSIRAMNAAIKSGSLPKELAAKLQTRSDNALHIIDTNVKTSLESAVVSVEIFRDGVKDPLVILTSFNRGTLEAEVKKIDPNLTINDEGVIVSTRTSARYGTVIVKGEKDDLTAIDLTKQLFDTLSDARASSLSNGGK